MNNSKKRKVKKVIKGLKKASKLHAGQAKVLKKVPAGKKGKGLKKLPKQVRNKMGFMKKGGSVK